MKTALKLAITFWVVAISTSALAQKPNGKISYIVDGNAVSPWHMVVGDESQWYQPFKGNFYRSKNGGITYEKKVEDGKMISVVTWNSRKKRATFSLSGNEMDLSALPDSIGLAIDIKKHDKLRKKLLFSLDCGYPCRASVDLKHLLKAFPVGEWVTLPIPLRCFVNGGLDLSNIDSPMHLESKGKFTISIGDVGLTKLSDGSQLCAD